MRRLPGWLFTLCPVASLALCLATAALWAGSLWRVETLTFWRMSAPMQPPGNDEVSVKVARGHVEIARSWRVYAAEEYAPHWWPRVGQGWETIYWGTSYAAKPEYDGRPPDWLYSRPFLGFRVADMANGTPSKPGGIRGVVVPLWFPLVVFATVPLWVFPRRARVQRRRRLRLCPACGYDLRASPERCPECGATAGSNHSITQVPDS